MKPMDKGVSTPLDAITSLLKVTEGMLPSTGELGNLRKIIEEAARVLTPYVTWQPVNVPGFEHVSPPKDRPILALLAWDTPPAVIWWDEEEDCWQYSAEEMGDSLGVVEDFVGWAELFDLRFHTGLPASITEGVTDGPNNA